MQMAQNNNSTQLWFNKKNDDMICYECFHINEVEEAKCRAQVAQVIHVKKDNWGHLKTSLLIKECSGPSTRPNEVKRIEQRDLVAGMGEDGR